MNACTVYAKMLKETEIEETMSFVMIIFMISCISIGRGGRLRLFSSQKKIDLKLYLKKQLDEGDLQKKKNKGK